MYVYCIFTQYLLSLLNVYLFTCYCRNQDNIFLFLLWNIKTRVHLEHACFYIAYKWLHKFLAVTITTSMPNLVPVNVCIRIMTSIRSAVVHSSVAFTSLWTVVSSVASQIVLNACSSTVGLQSAIAPLCYTCWKENKCIV